MPTAWPVRLRSRLLLALAASLALHLLVALGLYLVGRPAVAVAVKRGEPLFVELPELPDRAPAGNPAERRLGHPPAPALRATPRPAVMASAKPAPRPTPGPVAAPPAETPRPSVRPAPSPPPADPPAAPPASPPPPPPVPSSPPASVALPAGPTSPNEATAAVPPVAAAAPPTPSASSPGPRSPEPGDRASPAAPSGSQGPPQVALATPGSPPAPPAVDIRTALRGGGAGGRGDGRGGIEGEPIPLDTADLRYSEYFERVRRMIKERWGYPCVKNADTRQCEYKTASLVVEFGIAKDGRVPFVTVRQSSGWPIYDDYAVNAIKLAAPFPPIPDAVSRTGLPVLARFNYIVDTSLTNLLR